MSETHDLKESANSPVSVTLGGYTYSNIAVFADNYTAVGGGKVVEAQTSANSHVPVGVIDYSKEISIIMAIESVEVKKNLEDGNFWNHNGSNQSISFSYRQKRAGDDRTRTVTFVQANTRIASMKVQREVPNRVLTEIEILTWGKPTYGAWT